MLILDHQVFDDIHLLMKDRMPQLVLQFTKGTEAYTKEIEDGFQHKKPQQISLAAHTLKSSSANLGAMRASRQAEALELAANSNSPIWVEIEGMISTLNTLLAQSIDAMQKRLSA